MRRAKQYLMSTLEMVQKRTLPSMGALNQRLNDFRDDPRFSDSEMLPYSEATFKVGDVKRYLGQAISGFPGIAKAVKACINGDDLQQK